MDFSTTMPTTRPGPNGWRYRVLGLAFGFFSMLWLSSYYSVGSLVALLSGPGRPSPAELVNSSLWGFGFAFYLIPFGLLAGWISAEASLLAARSVSRARRGPAPRRLSLATCSTAVTLAVSLGLSLIFGFQIPYFYAGVMLATFASTYAASAWLNPLGSVTFRA